MLISNPVRGEIRPDARFYSGHEKAVHRPAGSNIPLVTQDFGPSELDVEPTVVWSGGEFTILDKPIAAKTYANFHRALDISKGGCGADVLAAASGEVRVSHKDESRANVIVIGHGKIGGHRYQTRYVHLQERLVDVGAHVEAGDVIGKLGDTGLHSSGCHLHFAHSDRAARSDCAGHTMAGWRHSA